MRFKEMLVDTAFDGIQEKRGLKLDRKGMWITLSHVYCYIIHGYPTVLRYLKMSYKGTPTQNIIRKPLDDKEVWSLCKISHNLLYKGNFGGTKIDK